MSNYLISQADIIGRQPFLRIDNMSRVQTLLGGFLCIIVYCFFILSSLYFGQELVYRVVPKIIDTEREISENDKIIFSKEYFSFFFSFFNNGNFINPISYLYFNLYMKNIINGNIEENSKEIELGICNENDFSSNNNDNSFYDLNISKFLCPKNLNMNYYIKGTNKFKNYAYLKLIIKPCLNNPKCKSEEEIKEILKISKLSILYFDTKYDFRKFKNFSSDIVKKFELTFNKNTSKLIEVTLSLTKVYTDKGYLFEIFTKKELHKIRNIKEYIYNIDNPKDFNITIDFKMDYTKNEIYRKYYKFQNWVAELGGIIRTMTLIASFINYFNDKASYYQLLINKLFDVDDIIKYFQFSDTFVSKQSKRKKRDSIVLRNAKKEKDYFEKGLFQNISDKKLSPQITNNFVKKSFKGKNSSTVNLNLKDDTLNYLNIVSNLNKQEEIKINLNLSAHNNNKEINNSFLSSGKYFERENYIENLKRNNHIKDHFEKVKSNRFSLNCFESCKFTLKKDKYNPKYNSFIGGRELIIERTDLIYILKKNLELDRFKNLILKDNQLLLLNSLTKFMLDPERVNLIDFETCSYEKFIDCYDNLSNNSNMIDLKLTKWVENKFKLEQHNISAL